MKKLSQIINPNPNTDSPIEETLYLEFIKYGLSPVPQYQVGVFRIDLAFPDIKLAIEADGKEFHSTKEQIERDKYREDKLKKQGWVFERFSGSFIHSNSEMAVAKIVLKYFNDKMSQEMKNRAMGRVVNYYSKTKDIEFVERLIDAHSNGFAFKER